MSSFNYMDNVPVKISEKYKPPPRLYQLPQSVTNKLNYPDGHFHNCPQYSYDFQLEHTVLAKIPDYKRKRQIDREARQERREKREQERQRLVEEKHKQMLGAVNYPNAAELSSSESDDEDDSEKSRHEVIAKSDIINKDASWLASYSFNNILQPTVLTHNGEISENNVGDALRLSYSHNSAKTNINTTGNSGNSNKLANTFNYKDFEEDTSSPFDNIELKTINDLDILRQVLHNTQLKANKDSNEHKENNSAGNSCDNDVVLNPTTKENLEETLNTMADTPQIVSDMSTFENTKAALEKVNFSDINLELEQNVEQEEHQKKKQQNDNIPTHNYKNIANYYVEAGYSVPKTTTLLPSNTCYPMPHFLNGIQDQHNYQIYHNQNYLYSPNSSYNNATTLQTQQMHYIANNANNLLQIVEQTKDSPILQDGRIPEDEEQNSKSKSVPDLFQELRNEVRNSEMRRRRSRNYSHNFDGSNELRNEKESDNEICSPKENADDALDNFNSLTSPMQELVRNISSMGFPLQRVARIAQIYSDDDKKIVEHLIPLTELLDLGFDEKQISDALVKYDNNKEKALEHLIS